MIKRSMWLCIVVVLLPHIAFTSGPLFDAPVNYSVGDEPKSVFCIDLDGDNDDDLAVADDSVSIMLNNGDGSFQPAFRYAAGDGPVSVFCSDLDGDGDPDLAVANGGSNDVSILLNNGEGTFQVAVNYAAGVNSVSVFCSDLDGDNYPDLAVANHASDNVSILLSNGDGTFQAAIDYAAGDGPQSVFCSDLDGDNDVDLAVANRLSNDVSIMLNNGDGTFQPAVDYTSGRSVNSVFCSDLDGDNDLDLATANRRADNVAIFLNNGDGTFQQAVRYPAGDAPRSAICADLDGDNYPDLAVANYLSDSISILLNNGDGTFQQAVRYPVGGGPWSVFCSDLDGDNNNDLAVTNSLSDDVSILLNLTRIIVNLDIKPGSCPNPLNADRNDKGKAVLPVAILGTSEFDVREIDPESITLNGISPIRWSYEDVSTPVDKDGDSCACSEDGIDGHDDMTLKFDRQAIVEALSSEGQREMVSTALGGNTPDIKGETGRLTDQSGPPNRDSHILRVEGRLHDGSKFEGFDCVLVRTKGDVVASAAKETTRKPELIGNHPNPFNPMTSISFYLPEAVPVRLEIYNVRGQRVATLIDQMMEAGGHTVKWDGSNIASGVYLYHLKAGEFAAAKKMLLLK